MRLIIPTMEYDRQIQDMRQDFIAAGSSIDGSSSLLRFQDTAEWLAHVIQNSSEETAPAGTVPTTQYIWYDEDRDMAVGVIQVRHYLDRYLADYAGHIGYSIRPSERRKGQATRMLAAALDECRNMGLERVMVSCFSDNEGSRRTILNNGGVFDREVYLPARDTAVQRYWIIL